MALDAATIALAAKELSAQIVDAKIDKIFEPTRDEVVLNLRLRGGAGANPRLFVSARSGSARVCLTQESFENPASPPSFCMLLRKHFTGGRLLAVRTIQDERIVFFDFQCTSEMGDTVQNTLAVELMGRYSNLVLVQGGKIIDALKRVDFEDSDVRQLLPGLAYTLPPPQAKLSFLTADVADILAAMAEKPTSAADALMKTTGGVGPVVCREAVFRAFAGREVLADAMTDADKTALASAIHAVRAIYEQGGAPTAVLAPDGRPTEFSFLPLTQYGDAMTQVPYANFSQMLEGYYAVKDKAERLHQKSKDLAKTVRNAYDRGVRKQAARREEQAQSAAADHLRVWGELLSANAWAFARGDREVTVTNYYDDTRVTIPLDVRLSPSGNAQKYFKDYKKKQTAARMLTQLLVDGEREIAYLETVLYEVSAAEGEQALGDIRAELKSQGYLKYYKAKDKKQKAADFLRYVSTDGFLMLVGRNNLQNDKLTLKTARGRDLWFHIKNAPGSHVVVITEGQPVPDTTKTQAAQLAALHSSQNSGVKVEVDYTEVRNVRKTSDCKPGLVLYDPYETALVAPDAQSLAALALVTAR